MSEEARKDDRIVQKVRVVVHSTGTWPNNKMSDNHWSIYLVLADDEGSVRMNMWAQLDDPTGRLQWSPLGYTMTHSAIKSWDYQTVIGTSVKKVYTVVMSNGRDKYEMSGGGSGCRYWVYIIVKDLAGKGYLLKKGAGTDLWEKLLYQYSNTGHIKPLAMVKGEFTSAASKSSAAHSTSSASSAVASSSAASAKAITGAPIRVSVESYVADGQLCYSWKRDGVEDRSYAKDWTSFTDKTGKLAVFHKAKNLFSRAP